MDISSDVAYAIMVMAYMDMSSDVAHAIVVTLYMDTSCDVAHVVVETSYMDTSSCHSTSKTCVLSMLHHMPYPYMTSEQ
jgi:hypothetical protein